MTTPAKFDDVIVDGAVLYLTNTDIADPKTDLSTIANDYLGTVKSSIAIKCKPVIREIEHLGKMGRKTAYDERITGYEISTEADILDYNAKTFGACLLEKGTTTATEHDVYIPKTKLAATDYKNLVVVGKKQGTDKPIVVVVENTYNMEGLQIEHKDNDESACKMTFEGHYEINSNVPPMKVFLPKVV